MATTKPGRPPRSGKPASVRVELRLTPQEHAAWLKRAGDLPLGEWIRRRCDAPTKHTKGSER